MCLKEYLEKNLEKSTVKNYLYEIEKCKKHYKNPEKLTYQNILNYIELIRKTYNPQSVKRTIYALKKYFDFLIEMGKRKDNPVQNIKLKDGKENPIQLQELLTEKELKKLLEPRKERYKTLEKRNQIIMSLLVNQALLVSDIVALKVTNLDLKKGKIKIAETGKTNSRLLELKADQILLFYQFLEENRKELENQKTSFFLLNKLGNPITKDDINYLISTYQRTINKKLTTVRIRQSVIKLKLSQSENLRKVQYFAGHKHADTTEKYRETGLESLQTAVNQYHPLK